MRQIAFLRGSFISSYAHVEFLLADICVKTWPRREYQHLRSKFPYQADTRVKAANALFESPGPLSIYRADISGLFNELLRFEEVRDFFAHGLLRMTVRNDEVFVHLNMYKPEKGGLKLGTINMDLRQMAGAAADIVKFTHKLMLLFHRIYLEQKLEYPETSSRMGGEQ